jgi:hypothetical protein
MKEVTKKVRDITQGAQIQQTYAKSHRRFYFLKGTVPVSNVTPQPPLASPSSERTQGIATDAGESLRAFWFWKPHGEMDGAHQKPILIG